MLLNNNKIMKFFAALMIFQIFYLSLLAGSYFSSDDCCHTKVAEIHSCYAVENTPAPPPSCHNLIEVKYDSDCGCFHNEKEQIVDFKLLSNKPTAKIDFPDSYYHPVSDLRETATFKILNESISKINYPLYLRNSSLLI